MSIKASGPLSISNIVTEFGGNKPHSLSEYYKDKINTAGIPEVNNPIPFSAFYDKNFIELEVITSTTQINWVPRNKNAKNMHVYVIGAGGSGGAAVADDSGATRGVAAAGAGGAGGLGYFVFPNKYIPRSATIRAGTGGKGASKSGRNSGIAGNFGTSSYFRSSSPFKQIFANGGSGGGAAWWSGSGRDTAEASGAGGGGGSMTNSSTSIPGIPNVIINGGSGGSARASGRGTETAAGGGGAPAFLNANDNFKNGAAGSNSNGAGAKPSDYLSTPNILTTYLENRGESSVFSLYSFNASNGNGGNANYGAGSGGAASRGGTATSGNGGNGIIIIVYEI